MGQHNYITDVIQLMGLTTEEGSSFIPIANEENKRLVDLVNQLTKTKADKSSVVNYYNGRLIKLQDHFKSADVEFDQNLVGLFLIYFF